VQLNTSRGPRTKVLKRSSSRFDFLHRQQDFDELYKMGATVF